MARSGATERQAVGTRRANLADPEDRRTDGAPPNHIQIEKNKATNRLAWILLALGLLALLFALVRRGKDDDAAVAPTPTVTGDGVGMITTENARPSDPVITVIPDPDQHMNRYRSYYRSDDDLI